MPTTTRTAGQTVSVAGVRGIVSRIRQQNPTLAQALDTLVSGFDLMQERLRSLAQSGSSLDPTNRIAVDGWNLNDGSVEDVKIRTLTADKITAGTIDAAEINVINLNASNMNVGTLDAAIVSIINLDVSGSITAGSITVSQLNFPLAVVVGANPQNHNPTSPSISWSACTVYLNGTAYLVTFGNTTQPFVYWTVGAGTFTAAASFSPQAGVYLIYTNVAGVYDEAWRKTAAASITGAAVAANTLTGGTSGNLAINTITGGTTGNLATNTVTGDNIVAATITTNHLAAQSVRAQQLVVGNFDNFCEDPGFEGNLGTSWTSLFSSFAYSSVDKRNGTYSYRKSTAVPDDEAFNAIYIPCRPGDTFYAEAYGKGTGNGTVKVRLNFWDAAKSTRSFTDSSTGAADSTFKFVSVSAAVPANRVWAQISVVVNSHTTGLWYIDDCFIKQRVTTAVIEDAAITAAKIGSVDAGTITTGTLAAGRLAAGSIDTTKLNIKSILLFGFTFTSNSPSAGYIAWSSGTVYYNGTAYNVSAGNTNLQQVYWDVGNATFTAGASYTLQANRFAIATNTSGAVQETWNQPGRNSLQEANISGGLIRGVQPQVAYARNTLNTAVTHTLLNYSGGGGALYSVGFRIVDTTTIPPLAGGAAAGNLLVVLGITIDGGSEAQFTVIDGLLWGNNNAWDLKWVGMCTSLQGVGNQPGDFSNLYIGLGFSTSCLVRVYPLYFPAGTARADMTVTWGTRTS